MTKLALDNTPRIPEWTKWKGRYGRGLRHYIDGINLSREGDYDQAAVEFREAIHLDPGNALARAEYAISLEGSGRYLDALEIYLSLSDLDSGFFQPRYRAGVVMDLCQAWIDDWNETDNAGQKQRDRIHAELVRLGLMASTDPIPSDSNQEVIGFFSRMAGLQLQRLREDVRLVSIFRRWSRQDARILLGGWLRPFGIRAIAKAAVDTAIQSQKLNEWLNSRRGQAALCGSNIPSLVTLRTDPCFLEMERGLTDILKRGVMKKLKRYGPGGRYKRAVPSGNVDAMGRARLMSLPTYNAACFYARLVGTGPNIGTYDVAAKAAINHLGSTLALAELRQGWMLALENDPDFKLLMEHTVYHGWFLKRLRHELAA